MTYQFSGSVPDLMSGCLADLRSAHAEGLEGDAYLRRALVALVGLHHLQATTGPAEPAALARFRTESAEALLQLRQRVAFFASETRIDAEGANEDEWARLCMHRSAIQCLIEDYADTPIPDLFPAEELAALDEELRRVGDAQGPLEADECPAGLPATHWWWRYPQDIGGEAATPAASAQPQAARPDIPQADLAGGQRASLVLMPGCSFALLRDILQEAGWPLVEASSQPILPGEPEQASFARSDGSYIVYSFNPVCLLRVIDLPLLPATAMLARLPLASGQEVASWLASADERTQLRGILAARQMPHAALLPAVEALDKHPRASIAQAARDAVVLIRRQLQAQQMQAHDHALQAIDILAEQLRPFLMGLLRGNATQIESLRPRPGDAAKAFAPEFATAAGDVYAALWASPPRITSMPSDSSLQLNIAPAGMLAEDNELSWRFPGGYRAIAPLLDPHRVWVAWKYIPRGKDAGMAYDGLVWLDDHWAWYPKPYRALAHLLPAEWRLH